MGTRPVCPRGLSWVALNWHGRLLLGTRPHGRQQGSSIEEPVTSPCDLSAALWHQWGGALQALEMGWPGTLPIDVQEDGGGC
jgi:hypothetical protein